MKGTLIFFMLLSLSSLSFAEDSDQELWDSFNDYYQKEIEKEEEIREKFEERKEEFEERSNSPIYRIQYYYYFNRVA